AERTVLQKGTNQPIPTEQLIYETSVILGFPAVSISQVNVHGSHPSRWQSSRSRSNAPRSRSQSGCGWRDHGGGHVGSKKKGNSSPTGSPRVGVVRPVASAPGIPRTESAPGPVPGTNRYGPQICSAICSGVGPAAEGVP